VRLSIHSFITIGPIRSPGGVLCFFFNINLKSSPAVTFSAFALARLSRFAVILVLISVTVSAPRCPATFTALWVRLLVLARLLVVLEQQCSPVTMRFSRQWMFEGKLMCYWPLLCSRSFDPVVFSSCGSARQHSPNRLGLPLLW